MTTEPTKPSRSRYAAPSRFTCVTLVQISAEIGRTQHQTVKLLHKLDFMPLQQRWYGTSTRPVYDARAIEAVKGLLRQPHRKLGTSTDDWLAKYEHPPGGNEDD